MSRAFVKDDAESWGEGRLKPYVEQILARAQDAGDEHLAQLAERFLRS